MAAYSMDLRKRVLGDWDAGMDAETWPRSTRSAARGSIAWCSGGARPARSSRGAKPSFAPARWPSTRSAGAPVLAQPDATLVEIRDGAADAAGLSHDLARLGRLGFTVKKNGTRRRTTPA